jgi:SAM-dependent methyltransferase
LSASPAPEEPLAESAPLAFEWAGRLCMPREPGAEACDWYHGAWQYLRLLKIISGIEAEATFFMSAFRPLARAGDAARILVAGTADYGMLALVLAACEAERAVAQVSVTDRCACPLRLNRWYAEHRGTNVRTIEKDVFELEMDAAFDLLCTHSFLSSVAPEKHEELARQWCRLLRPGGRLVTSQSIRPSYPGEHVRFTAGQADAFGAKVEAAARTARCALSASPEALGQLGVRYARHKTGFVVRSAERLAATLRTAGFDLEVFRPADEPTHARHRAATPDGRESWQRFEIVAVKK